MKLGGLGRRQLNKKKKEAIWPRGQKMVRSGHRLEETREKGRYEQVDIDE